MVNYACDLNQSETGKYFEWIIILFRFMSVTMVQTKCKLNSTLSYSSNCFIFRAKKLDTTGTTKELAELEKWQSEISPEY